MRIYTIEGLVLSEFLSFSTLNTTLQNTVIAIERCFAGRLEADLFIGLVQHAIRGTLDVHAFGTMNRLGTSASFFTTWTVGLGSISTLLGADALLRWA